MGKREVLKVYRAQPIGVAGAVAGALGFLVIGLSMVVSQSQVGVSGVVVGATLILLAAGLAAVLIGNRLVVTHDGLVYYENLRKRFIPWAAVRSVEVGRARSVLPWRALVINTTSGSLRVAGIAGTPSFAARVAEELQSYQRHYPSSSPSANC